MKNLKKWLLIVGLASPTVANLSCSSALLQQMRDAAIDGASSFVQEMTFELLEQNVSLDGMGG